MYLNIQITTKRKNHLIIFQIYINETILFEVFFVLELQKICQYCQCSWGLFFKG